MVDGGTTLGSGDVTLSLLHPARIDSMSMSSTTVVRRRIVLSVPTCASA